MPAAAAMAAAGAAQIQAIRNAEFGGGVAPSLAGSTVAPPTQNVSSAGAAPDNRALFIQGIQADSLFTGSQLRQLGERISEFLKDGGQITFADA